jgi:PBP1b-binding outer membrane lipoprotein LpoB
MKINSNKYTMKKILSIILLAVLILQGCDDFLEEEPLSIETAESYMETVEGLESLIGCNLV